MSGGYGGWAMAVASVALLGSVVAWSVASAARPSGEPPLIAAMPGLKVRAETVAGRYLPLAERGPPMSELVPVVIAIDATERPRVGPPVLVLKP